MKSKQKIHSENSQNDQKERKSRSYFGRVIRQLKRSIIGIVLFILRKRVKKKNVEKYVSGTNNLKSKTIPYKTIPKKPIEVSEKRRDNNKRKESTEKVRRSNSNERKSEIAAPRKEREKGIENIKSTNTKVIEGNLNQNKKKIDTGTSSKVLPKRKVRINPETVFIKPEEEKRTQIKFIGYDPNDDFYQNEPYNYPYVIMPKPRNIIKFPRKNKVGNKGYTEDFFRAHLEKYLKNYFKIYDDRLMVITPRQNPYEPDITLIDEDTGLNLFIDVEIDEPYDGITREPMHYRGYNNDRDKYFRNRGWLSIRFAEIQVWKNLEGCCKFLFNVIRSIDEKYSVPNKLESVDDLELIPQWTAEQAREWAKMKYREQYLNIDDFFIQNIHKELEGIDESELEYQIEEQINETGVSIQKVANNLKAVIINQAINTGKYISCKHDEESVYTILRPISFNGQALSCYCYIKNTTRKLNIKHLTDLIIRDQPSLVRINGEIGVDEIKRVINEAIHNNKLVRMKYTRSSWSEYVVDEETGEMILNRTESEQSLRTISNVDYSINVLDDEHFNQYNLTEEDYITAYCHKREDQRTFRFDRINELEILNI